MLHTRPSLGPYTNPKICTTLQSYESSPESPLPPRAGIHQSLERSQQWSPLSEYQRSCIEGWLSCSTTERATSPPSVCDHKAYFPSVMEVDYGDSHLHTSLRSAQSDEGQYTQPRLELQMSIKFHEELGAIPFTVHERFQQRYGPYPLTTWPMFLNVCILLKRQDGRNLSLHPFLWDDFI